MHRLIEHALFDMEQARGELLREIARVTEADWSRFVPFGHWTLKDLLAHVAGFDGIWAMTTRSLLASDGVVAPPRDVDAARQRAIERGRQRSVASLMEELHSRRRLLAGYLELLEERHLARSLPLAPPGEDSVRAQIWVGYHDRQHAADIRRALAISWQPEHLTFLPEVSLAARALSPDPALRVMYSVAPETWASPSPTPGWTYHDLLAHLATADRVFQRHLSAVLETGEAGPRPDSDAANRDLVEARRGASVDGLIEEYIASRHETLRLLSRLRPAHLHVPMPSATHTAEHDSTLLDYVNAFPRHEARHLAALRTAARWRRG